MRRASGMRMPVLAALLLGGAGLLSFAVVNAGSGGTKPTPTPVQATPGPTEEEAIVATPPSRLSEPVADPEDTPRPTSTPQADVPPAPLSDPDRGPQPAPDPVSPLPAPVAPSGCVQTVLVQGTEIVDRFDHELSRWVTEMGTMELWQDGCTGETFGRDIETGEVYPTVQRPL